MQIPYWVAKQKRYDYMNKKIVVGIIIGVIILISAYSIVNHKNNSQISMPSIGQKAPSGSFFLTNGSNVSVSNYYGNTILLWFVTTWCSSCAQGTVAISNNMSFFQSRNVTVIEVENYKDMGHEGLGIVQFVKEFGTNSTGASLIKTAVSSKKLTYNYNPKGYLDLYYLILPNGTIAYINGSPAITMPNLKRVIDSI